MKVESSPDGSVSPEECGVRASYGRSFCCMVWVRYPSSNTSKTKVFCLESPLLNIHSNPGVVVITGRGPHPSDIVYGLFLLFN